MYAPHMMADPAEFLTLNGTVPRTTGIFSAASGIESTTLVLVTGLDLFFNRATPSGGFDLLASDFNRPLLLLTVVGMAVATALLRHFSRGKALSLMWA